MTTDLLLPRAERGVPMQWVLVSAAIAAASLAALVLSLAYGDASGLVLVRTAAHPVAFGALFLGASCTGLLAWALGRTPAVWAAVWAAAATALLVVCGVVVGIALSPGGLPPEHRVASPDGRHVLVAAPRSGMADLDWELRIEETSGALARYRTLGCLGDTFDEHGIRWLSATRIAVTVDGRERSLPYDVPTSPLPPC